MLPMRAFLPTRPAVTRLALVGDVHDQWSHADVVALHALRPDMTLFVGDIGNENVPLVERIASLDKPKAVILGNHDAFFTREPMIRATLGRDDKVDAVNAQLDLLGEDHVGFGRKEVPGKPVTIVGARPFSGGGKEKHPKVIENLYGYKGMDQYGEIITQTTLDAQPDHTIVMIGHNGPTELGSKRHDICGVDFNIEEGDHGDVDLRQALENLKKFDRSPALVAFGHMHHRLKTRNGQKDYRQRLVYDCTVETLYLNVAVVRRVTPCLNHGSGGRRRNKNQTLMHHFCIVEIQGGRVQTVDDVFVKMHQDRIIDMPDVMPLFKRVQENHHDEIRVFNTHLHRWESHIESRPPVAFMGTVMIAD